MPGKTVFLPTISSAGSQWMLVLFAPNYLPEFRADAGTLASWIIGSTSAQRARLVVESFLVLVFGWIAMNVEVGRVILIEKFPRNERRVGAAGHVCPDTDRSQCSNRCRLIPSIRGRIARRSPQGDPWESESEFQVMDFTTIMILYI